VDKDVIKTFVDSVASLFGELLEYIANAEEKWQLFKAVLASSAAWPCRLKRISAVMQMETNQLSIRMPRAIRAVHKYVT